jgi:SAM-dependent methyltransferase
MMQKPWYEKLFENYGKRYDEEIFTQGTSGECDSIERELGYDTSLRILDVGCGTGRHAIELTRRGYSVTGIDLSEAQLRRAREKAGNLPIEWMCLDARHLPFESEFDAALMLCEGGFPLMETDQMNFRILQQVTKALKVPSVFIFTTLNGLYPLFHSINDLHTEGGAQYDSQHFNLMTFRDYNLTTFTDDDGVEHTIECSERYYVPSEITWLLKNLGYSSIEIFGARLGSYSREHELTGDDYEMLVIAKKVLSDQDQDRCSGNGDHRPCQ